MNRFSLVSVTALVAAAALIALPMLVEQQPAEIVTSLPRTERIVDLPEDGEPFGNQNTPVKVGDRLYLCSALNKISA